MASLRGSLELSSICKSSRYFRSAADGISRPPTTPSLLPRGLLLPMFQCLNLVSTAISSSFQPSFALFWGTALLQRTFETLPRMRHKRFLSRSFQKWHLCSPNAHRVRACMRPTSSQEHKLKSTTSKVNSSSSSQQNLRALKYLVTICWAARFFLQPPPLPVNHFVNTSPMSHDNVKPFWHGLCSIDIRPNHFALLAHFPFLRAPLNPNHNKGPNGKQKNCIYMCAFAKTCPYLPALFSIVQNSWQWQRPHLPKKVWVGLSVIHKGHLDLRTKVECIEKWSEICPQIINLGTTCSIFR